MTTPFVTYAYLVLGDGRATIAIATHDDNTVEIAVAICSPRDKFVKSKGREIALDRLKNKHSFYASFIRDPYEPIKSQATRLVKTLIARDFVRPANIDSPLELIINEIKLRTPNKQHSVPAWATAAVVNHQTY